VHPEIQISTFELACKDATPWERFCNSSHQIYDAGVKGADGVQDNDVERAANLDKDHLDYLVEESWRWALACAHGLKNQHFFSASLYMEFLMLERNKS
jgi:hypothetical protein